MSRYAMLQLLRRKGPMTAKGIAIELGLQHSTIRTCIQRARAGGSDILCIVDWRGKVAVYGPGPGQDVEGGGTEWRILSMLEHGEQATVAQIAARLCASRTSIEAAIHRIRAKGKPLRVVAWYRHRGRGGRASPVFTSGPGEDAPAPDFTHAQSEALSRYREKIRVQLGRRRVRMAAAPATPPSRPVAGPFDGLFARQAAFAGR